jgi:ABC-type antimicrobial peptide transport system permease subunit
MKNVGKRNKKIPVRFDVEGFYLSFGIGAVALAVGLFLAWAILTAPEGSTNSTGFTLAQRLARTLPHSVQQWIALGLSGLFILFGVFCILLGIKNTIVFVIDKIKGTS